MDKYSNGTKRGSRMRAASVMMGVAVNVLLAFVSYKAGLPVYMDSVGTMTVAAVGGLFPGIMTAIASNAICTVFNSSAAYFGIINAFIAIYTAWAVRKKNMRKPKNIAVYVAILSSATGIFSTLIELTVLGGAQNDSLRSMMETLGGHVHAPMPVMLTALNVMLEFFDKGLSSGVVLVLLPVVVIYLLLQRRFIEGVERSGIVG